MDNKATKPAKSLQARMRAIHRVLGYLAVGMVMVYALSGITLIYRTGDFMKKSTPVEETLKPGLAGDDLGTALKVKRLEVVNESDNIIYFKDGQYDKTTGKATYLKKEVVPPLDSFIDLHKLPVAKNTVIAIATTVFGVVLFLLALTSLFMYKPGTRQFRSSMIYTAIGVVVTVLLLIFV